MDDRTTDEHRTARTVTLVVPLPDRTAPDRPVRAPYIERPGRTEDRTPRPVERTGTEQDAVRPTPVETVRPVQPPPVRTTVRPEPVERIVWQEVEPAPERSVRALPGDGGRTHLKIAATAVPTVAAAGIVCGLVSSLWPLAVLAGAAAAGVLVTLLVRFARWLSEAIVRDAQ